MKKAIGACFKSEDSMVATIENIFFKEDGIWHELDGLALDASMFEESKRGISFISLEGSKRLREDKVKGFCHKRYKANFVISGMSTLDLRVGQVIQVGEAIIRITRMQKDCLPECPIIKDTKISCKVNKEAFFGELLKEGFVNRNDAVLL